MRTLKKVKKQKNIDTLKNNFFVFDTETTKLEPQPKNFVFGVLYGFNFVRVFRNRTDFIKEFKKKKYQGKYIFAHNAEFDLSVIYGNIYKHLDNQAVFNGKFISAKLDNLTFADSLNIFPLSAEKIGKASGYNKLENKKVKEGKLRKNNVTNEDINYCIRDCELIFNALQTMFEKVGSIKITISSLAMYDFRNNHLVNDLTFSENVDEFYESYYGGRCEAFKIGSTISEVFDINSLYPNEMFKAIFPDIRTLKKETKINVKYLHYLLSRFEGLAKVELLHNDSYFGFVPYRSDKLLFPVGRFETILNFNELRFAIEHKAIEILKVDYVVYSNPIESPFKSFVKYHYDIRKEATNELDKLIHKLLPNSLYGRFAMRKKYNQSYHDLIPYEIIEELQKTEKFYELKLFNQVRSDCYLITENEKFKNSFFAIPTFSSYITSSGRITLLKGLLSNEKNIVTYCDTDSIFLEKSFIGSVGKNLGQFKREDKEVIKINGLKHYEYINTPYNLESEMFYFDDYETIKGISKSSLKLSDTKYQKVQYYKTKEAIRQNRTVGERKEIIKELTFKYDKRIVLPNGDTKPIKL